MRNCQHGRISLLKGYPACMDCGGEFKNGELAKMRNQRMVKCSHEKLEHGYATNPPQSKCLDCGEFFTQRELNAIKPYTEEIERLREALSYYADEKNHTEVRGTQIFGDVFYDKGTIARKALEGEPNERM